jgi:DNA-binding transcriptional regulator YiaG
MRGMTKKELTTWRESLGLTQGELATMLGVHIITVNRWENGAREIPPFLPLALQTLERETKKPARAKAQPTGKR